MPDTYEQAGIAGEASELHDAERRSAIGAAEGIMHNMLGYLPDQPGDARKLREMILDWLSREAVKNNV